MDITNRKSHENKFLLEAEEIERIMEELTKLLSDEPVDRKDALRLKLILEETLLNYMDFYPEGTQASLRFSRSLGVFRVSLKVAGEKMDPFQEKDSSFTSIMGSLLANSNSLNRAWKYRDGANLVTFTLAKKRKVSQIVLNAKSIGKLNIERLRS